MGFDIAKWDFMQQYPRPSASDDPIDSGSKKTPQSTEQTQGIAIGGRPQFTYDIHAEGMIEAKV